METKGIILLVEDNTRLNTANRRVLELSGYTVAAAETVTAAWEHLNRQEPDIILLDVMLPDGDGVDLCREIRKQSKAHIIYLTAKTEYEDLSRGLEAGGDDYIRKPFHPGSCWIGLMRRCAGRLWGTKWRYERLPVDR